jgi:hypothetical protein
MHLRPVRLDTIQEHLNRRCVAACACPSFAVGNWAGDDLRHQTNAMRPESTLFNRIAAGGRRAITVAHDVAPIDSSCDVCQN